ncbi:MAG TPA: ABC transporter permease [Acidimicrobiales bacterium]|nr:ABC transporter permease [Acidimicrobiales bacterium]
MNGAHQTWLVAARELRERGRSRAFLGSLVLMLLAVAGAIVLPAFLDTGPGTKDVGLTGTSPAGLPAALQAQGGAVGTKIRIHRYDTQTGGEAAVRDGGLDVLVVDGRQLEWRKRADEQLKAVVTGAIQLVTVRERAEAAGMNPDDLLAVVQPLAVTNVGLGQVAGRSPDDETAAFLMTLILFFSISTYGAMVLSGVVEEKSSRTVEVLLARMPARNLLAGKIAGIGLLGLAQVAATAVVALVAASLADSFDVPAVRGTVLVWAVVWFVLGYALYATVFGALGSLASRTEDASSVTGPVTVLLVLGFMVSFAAIGSTEATWAHLVSWFPITAPLAMPNRIAMGVATWWDPVVAVSFTVATIAGLVVLGGRVYTRAMLHTGATLSLGDAWRGAPRPTRSNVPTVIETTERKEEPVVTQSTTREARTLLILIVTAMVVGGVVFALAGDFVVGVGVGAAFFALTRQALKVWGRRSDHEADTSRGRDREPLHQ